MTQTYSPSAQLNAAIEAMFPSTGQVHTATATNTSTTLTFSVSESLLITPGMTVTGAGISANGLVTSVNNSTGVVTISGTITTLTTSAYTFSQAQFGSLHTATPGFTGASECSDANYARQSVTFTAPASGGFATPGQKSSSNAQTWPAGSGATGFAAGQTIAYFGFFARAALSGGVWLGGGILGASLTVPIGAQVFAAIGAITVAASG